MGGCLPIAELDKIKRHDSGKQNHSKPQTYESYS